MRGASRLGRTLEVLRCRRAARKRCARRAAPGSRPTRTGSDFPRPGRHQGGGFRKNPAPPEITRITATVIELARTWRAADPSSFLPTRSDLDREVVAAEKTEAHLIATFIVPRLRVWNRYLAVQLPPYWRWQERRWIGRARPRQLDHRCRDPVISGGGGGFPKSSTW